MDAFVIELLTRIHEPHSSTSRVATFCEWSDPVPCSPHYTYQEIHATLEYVPGYCGSAAMPFLRLLAKRNVSLECITACYMHGLCVCVCG